MPAHGSLDLPSLVSELEHHPVNTNIFFETFKHHRLSDEQLRAFLQQYRYFCKHFIKALEGLLFRTPLDQLEMRIELTRTLFSELGNGDPSQAHITLLDNVARSLGLNQDQLEQTVPRPGVEAYLNTLHRLFIESDYRTALGAEMAVELTAAAEFRSLYPGFKLYDRFRPEDLRFFQLHVEEEVCHGTWLIDAVRQTARSEGDLELVASGARQTADAWHEFWLRLYEDTFGPREWNDTPPPITRINCNSY